MNSSLCASLGHRTAVPQPETLVVHQQFVAAKTHCAGTVDAASFHSVDAGSAIEFGGGRNLPYQCHWRSLEHFKAYLMSAVLAYNFKIFARLSLQRWKLR